VTTENPIYFILISMVTMCLGWGIRGLIIGGEKGSLVPGAFMGILCVWYTGSNLLMENVYLFAAACALGYSYGGMEPYGETMDLIMKHDSPRYNPSMGYLALAFKGSIWGGLGAAFLGMSFSAMSGVVYRWYDFVIFFALVPLAQELGYRLFNTPYNPDKGIRPKICFSWNSREEWGRNVVIVAGLLVLMAVRGDVFGILMWVSGALSGAIGWIIGITFYDKEKYPLKNGKYLFGKFEKMGVINGWKIMEYTQGAVQGLGISAMFVVAWPLAQKNLLAAEMVGELWHPIPQTLDTVLSWVFCALMILTVFLFIIPYRKNGNKITEAFGEVDMNLVEVLERPCYMVLPLSLVMLGSTTMAGIMCFFGMYYVVAQYEALEHYCDFKNITIIRIIVIALGAAILVGEILWGYELWQTWLLYCVGYLIFDAIVVFRPRDVIANRKKSKTFGEFVRSFGVVATVQPFAYLLSAIVVVFGMIEFL